MIRHYDNQFQSVADIFAKAIHSIPTDIYTKEQQNAWCSLPVDYEYWKWRCELKRPFLYTDGDVVVGFLELDSDGHIDCVYTHPNYQRKGVAQALLSNAIEICDELNIERMYVEASHLIRPLFEKNGFTLTSPNVVIRNGVALPNWFMERKKR